jgi:hypothetical protein
MPFPLPPALAYKAALFSAMRRDAISKSELARRPSSTREVRRAVDTRATKELESPAASRLLTVNALAVSKTAL